MTRTIDKLIIHCADTPNGESKWDASDIDFWHQLRDMKRDPAWVKDNAPELKHIGYHGVILIDGTFVPCRSVDEKGAHCAGANSHSIGWCLIGRDAFTPAQWETLKAKTEELLREHSGLAVFGHRDLNASKTCPGFDVGAWLDRGMEPLDDHIILT